MFESCDAKISRAVRALKFAAVVFCVASFSVFALDQSQYSLEDLEQLEVQRDLFWLTMIVWILVIGLLAFAFSIRYIARRTTHPCHWCTEFISNKATTCPRCGKSLDTVPASHPAAVPPAAQAG